MSMNLVTILYLIASICFIQALKGLSHPTTSRKGNAVDINLVKGLGFVLIGLLVGGSAGTIMAKRVEMTKMPELVAFMHSMIGLAAVFIAVAAVVEPQSLGIVAALGDAIPAGNRLELFLGAAIGAITFSGSAHLAPSGRRIGGARGRPSSGTSMESASVLPSSSRISTTKGLRRSLATTIAAAGARICGEEAKITSAGRTRARAPAPAAKATQPSTRLAPFPEYSGIGTRV